MDSARVSVLQHSLGVAQKGHSLITGNWELIVLLYNSLAQHSYSVAFQFFYGYWYKRSKKLLHIKCVERGIVCEMGSLQILFVVIGNCGSSRG